MLRDECPWGRSLMCGNGISSMVPIHPRNAWLGPQRRGNNYGGKKQVGLKDKLQPETCTHIHIHHRCNCIALMQMQAGPDYFVSGWRHTWVLPWSFDVGYNFPPWRIRAKEGWTAHSVEFGRWVFVLGQVGGGDPYQTESFSFVNKGKVASMNNLFILAHVGPCVRVCSVFSRHLVCWLVRTNDCVVKETRLCGFQFTR